MAELSELRAERLKKLNNLKSIGIDPYPSKILLGGERISSEQAKEILDSQNQKSILNIFAKQTSLDEKIIAGRIMSIRGQGKILFIDVHDQAGKFQVVLKKDIVGEEKIKTFFDNLDSGDFAAFNGKLFLTQKGEKSLEAFDWQILAKSLLPMPSTFYGLENEEEQMRKRYLDFALNKDKRDLFFKKAIFWKSVREFLTERGFLEVETPTIETTTGGAEARPFKTYHNDFDLDVFMRICIGELWQKRLMAANFEKTFEIGKAYRNEGSSPEHLQEFTNCEFYSAYTDFKEGMKMVREMYIEVAKKTFGKTKFNIRGHEFELDSHWPEIDYVEEIKNRTSVDILVATESEMKEKLKSLGVKWDGDNKERLTDTLWKYCRKQITGPAFLVNHPSIVAPLAKLNVGGKTAQQFQPIIAGSEVGRGYSELNDPLQQTENFQKQQKLLASGDEEAMMPDWEFAEMLEHGMPPTFGYGFGERLFSFLAELPIRETQLFPLVKPKTETVETKKKETKIAVAIINKGANMEKWQELNTVAHLSAEFAGKAKENLFYQDKIQTQDNVNLNLNIQHAILVKQITTSKEIHGFIENAKENNIEAYVFTREMLNTTNDKKVIEETKKKNFADVEFLGVLVFGEKEKIDSLTKNIEMYK